MRFKGLTATIAAIAIAAPLTLVSASAMNAPNNVDGARLGLQSERRAPAPHEIEQMKGGYRNVDVQRNNVGSEYVSNTGSSHVDGRVYNRRVERNEGNGHRWVDGINHRHHRNNAVRHDGVRPDNVRNDGAIVDGTRLDNVRRDGVRPDGVNNRRVDGIARRHAPFIRGFEDGNFYPDRPLTRAEFSKMLHSLYGERNVARHDGNGVRGAFERDGVRNTTNNARGAFDRDETRAGAFDIVGRNVERAGRDLERGVERTGRNIGHGAERTADRTTHGRTFGNVPNNHWARNEIQAIHGMGYFSTIDGDRFRADEPVTRTEFFQVLSHINGRTVNDDINRTHNGAVRGHGNDIITRAEAVAVLHQLEGRPNEWSGNMRFNDVHEGHWAHAHIMHAVNGHS